MTFSGKRLKEFRKIAKISQTKLRKNLEELAREVGIEDYSITGTTIRNYENGRSIPANQHFEMLQLYAQIQGVNPLFFYDTYNPVQ